MSAQLPLISGPAMVRVNHGAPIAAESVGPAGPVVRGATSPRVAAGPAGSVGIYRVTNAFTTYVWWCKACVVLREAAGWTCEQIGTVDGFACDLSETHQ